MSRCAAPEGRAVLLILLQQFTPRQVIALNLLLAQETVDRQVRGLYQRYLGRQPEAGGLAHFRAFLQNNGPEEEVIAQLIGSAEYISKI